MGRVIRNKYPQLDFILWDTKVQKLTPTEALEAYEKRWGFVDQNNLSAAEQTLINNLIANAGGLFLPAN